MHILIIKLGLLSLHFGTRDIKETVSRDFRCLQMILMNRTWVPDVPLEVYSFLNLHLHIVFLISKFTAG